jgi:GxxExxY protein
MKQPILHKALTDQIINCFYVVYNALGYGFLERVYENALMIELRKAGLDVARQAPIRVLYDEQVVGEYFADIIVEGKVILELKAAESISNAHKVQLQNYLKASQIEVGFIFNFGPQPRFERRVFSNRPRNPRQSA